MNFSAAANFKFPLKLPILLPKPGNEFVVKVILHFHLFHHSRPLTDNKLAKTLFEIGKSSRHTILEGERIRVNIFV